MDIKEADYFNKNKRMKLIHLISNFQSTTLLLSNKEKEKIKNFLSQLENENIFESFLKKKQANKEIEQDLYMLEYIINSFPILCNFFNDIIPKNESIFEYFFNLGINYNIQININLL